MSESQHEPDPEARHATYEPLEDDVRGPGVKGSERTTYPSPDGARLPKRLSPSAIVAYRQCPRAVWFSHIARVPKSEKTSPAVGVGNAVHAALELFFGLPRDRRSIEVLHNCLRSVWKQHRTPTDFATVDEEAAYGNSCLRLLSKFYATFDTAAIPIARERWMACRLPTGVELYTRVDRVDTSRTDGRCTLDIVDYKTGHWELDGTDLIDEPASQVHVLCARAVFRRPVRRVRLLYLASGNEARWEVEEEDARFTWNELCSLTSTMRSDRTFDPHPGEQCLRCEYRSLCPAAATTDAFPTSMSGSSRELPMLSSASITPGS
jgi:putative RecB family exonuclease